MLSKCGQQKFDIEFWVIQIAGVSNHVAELLSKWKSKEDNVSKLLQLGENPCQMPVNMDILNIGEYKLYCRSS